MKKYFAVGYFAHPEIGMVTAGEVLSEEQVKKLGTAVIDSLLKRGALGIIEDPKEKKTEDVKAPKDGAEAKDEENGTADEAEEPETVTEDEETETGAVLVLDEKEAAELAAELPELEISADMIGEETGDAKKTSGKKTSGRRK